MTERNFGEVVQSWIGIVTNVNDPHQSGRVQVRVFGRHDDVANIPDEDLPWAQVVQPVTSAARGRIGTAPVGMVVGSRVYGHWLDRDHQYPLIIGTVGRAGAPVQGQTSDGAPVGNTAFGSIPGPTQGDVNNPYSSLSPTRVSITDIDTGGADIDDVEIGDGVVVTSAVEEDMRFATAPTTCSADDNQEDVLEILNTVDPSSVLSALPCLPKSAIQISLTIDLGSIAAGFINVLADSLTRTLTRLMSQLGVDNVISAIENAAAALDNFEDAFNALSKGGLCGAPAALNSMATGTQALARSISQIKAASEKVGNSSSAIRRTLGYERDTILSRTVTAAFTPVSVVITAPTGYVQEYYAYSSDPYPGYIRWVDPNGQGDPVFTLRDGQPNYVSAAQHTSYEVGNYLQDALLQQIRTGTLDTTSLQNILTRATGIGQVSALTRAIGAGDPVQILSLAATVIPTIYANITGIFNAGISVSVLPNTGAIEQSMQRFTQAQSVLAVRRARMENAFRRL